MLTLLLAMQLTACPPSLTCTLPQLQTTPRAAVVADPTAPARWYVLANVAALGAFEGWALATHHNTVSQASQHYARAHAAYRWSLVGGMAMLAWHLAFGFPW